MPGTVVRIVIFPSKKQTSLFCVEWRLLIDGQASNAIRVFIGMVGQRSARQPSSHISGSSVYCERFDYLKVKMGVHFSSSMHCSYAHP